MNLSPGCRSQPHNLLLVGLTEGKPKNLDKILNPSEHWRTSQLGSGVATHNFFRVCDLPALATAPGALRHFRVC